MNAPSKQQLETQATFETALRRRQPLAGTPSVAVGVPAQFQGRKKDQDAWLLNIERIRVDADQVRRQGKGPEQEDTQALASSIREFGLLHAIDVRWIEAENIYEIVAGERRFTAIKEILNWQEVPVRVLNVASDQILWLQIHENIHRENLHPLDLAAAIKQAMEQGLSLDEVASKLSKSKTYVQKALTVATNLSSEAAGLLRTPDHPQGMDAIYEIATLPTASQMELAQDTVEKKLTRSQVREAAGKIKRSRAGELNRINKKVGRPRKSKPFSRVLKAGDGISMTIQARKSQVPLPELISAVKKALAALEAEMRQQKAA